MLTTSWVPVLTIANEEILGVCFNSLFSSFLLMNFLVVPGFTNTPSILQGKHIQIKLLFSELL